MPHQKSPHLADEEESYFVSMTDLMVGMLFVFIIMLMSFALNYRAEVAGLTSSQAARTQMLNEIKNSLKKNGVRVTIDEKNGILRLPEEILFDSGKDELKAEGINKLQHVAKALRLVLPCYSILPGELISPTCPSSPGGRLEAVFIEGHTDSDPLRPTQRLRDNWDLSAARSINTYKALIESQHKLENIRNDNSEQVLSVSGYGQNRPLPREKEQNDEDYKKANRRIDLRFLMATPRPEEANSVVENVNNSIGQQR